MGTGECNARKGGGGPCNGVVSHPGDSRNTPSLVMLQKLEISAGPVLICRLYLYMYLPAYGVLLFIVVVFVTDFQKRTLLPWTRQLRSS